MVARGERPPDRLDQLAGEKAALLDARRRRQQHRELGPGHARDQAARGRSSPTCRSIRRATACSTASPVARPKAALIAS